MIVVDIKFLQLFVVVLDMIIFQGEPHHDLVRDVRQNKGSILKVGKAVTGRYILDLTTCNLALGKCRVHKETKERDCREESLRREVSNSGCCLFHERSTVPL